MEYIDLTHTLSEAIPTWDGSCGFSLSINTDYKDCTPPDLFRTQKIMCGAGIGTHIDAPAHVLPGGQTIDALKLDNLIANCVVIDVSNDANESYMIMPEAIERFEKEYGQIPAQSFVIFYTGWDTHWEDRDAYNNNHMFPSVDVATAELLLKRNITGVGIDTLSCDRGDNGFPVHQAILQAGKYLVENIANAKLLPPAGSKVFIFPMKIENATEAPVRLIAVI
jgi:kynurenine formamidase